MQVQTFYYPAVAPPAPPPVPPPEKTLAGFTPYITTKGLPAFKQQFRTADGKLHEARIEAPRGVQFEVIGGRAYVVAREATVYFQPEGLAGIALPPTDDARSSLVANYGIGREFLSRGKRETSIETNDPSLAKVGLGLAGPPPPPQSAANSAVGGSLILAAIVALVAALLFKRKRG